MTYEKVKLLLPEKFKRLLYVRPETFAHMVAVMRDRSLPKKKSGRPLVDQPS